MIDISSLLFASCLFQGSYLVIRSLQAPNPNPEHAKADPVVNPTYLSVVIIYVFALASIGALHGLAALFPSTATEICPSINPNLFEWNTLTATLLIASLFGGYLRLVAYAQLREDFTFRLARPSRLVQSGVYAWVQHPSYSGMYLLFFSYCGLVFRSDGVLSCWLSSGILKTLVYVNWVYLVATVVILIAPRISKEEKMLRESFGAEWEEYHRRTARVVPMLF